MKKRTRIFAALLSGILLLAGCAGSEEDPDTTTVPPTAAQEENTAASEQTDDVSAEASLVSLRQAMVETPQLFAVAYFGYHDTMDSDEPVDPYAVMREQAPELCKDLPFLTEIPAAQVIGNHGDLFCIVPLDEDATVAVSRGIWEETAGEYTYEESLYLERSGEPILLFCNNSGFEPDTQLSVSGPSGDVIWYPQTDDNLCAMPLRNDNWDDLFFDFSPYRELLLAEYRSMNGEWKKPTAEMLTGTTWVWDRYLKDGREVSYRLTFAEDTLSVCWNDGIDEADHEYPDATWALTEEEGFCVLSIDFREFAGVLRYDLMYHEEFEVLYVGMDVVQEELPVGWEPLYRYLGESESPEPVEMLGDWELEWTEVEGYREYVNPGTENISIFLNDDNGFRITLTDTVFPGKSFKNKELGVYEGELYSGCGNDQWMCYIGYMGAENIIYSLTLTQDDILLMEMYWEIDDGVPMVAHKGYRRTGS
jgi:hypothetical protein